MRHLGRVQRHALRVESQAEAGVAIGEQHVAPSPVEGAHIGQARIGHVVLVAGVPGVGRASQGRREEPGLGALRHEHELGGVLEVGEHHARAPVVRPEAPRVDEVGELDQSGSVRAPVQRPVAGVRVELLLPPRARRVTGGAVAPPAVPPACARPEVVAVVRIHPDRQADLSEVGGARGAPRSVSGPAEDGEENGGENGYDGDDHQQFDEGEAPGGPTQYGAATAYT
jgi:hypothetical protein